MISVRGKVTDPKENPIENVRIIDTTGFEIWTETDSEGEFDLGRIPIRWPGRKLGTISFLAPRPDGAQVINSRAMIIKDVTSYAAGTGFVHHRQCQYNIEPDEDIELSVVLEPTELITLKGTVVCDNNSPAAGAAVSLFAGNAGQNTWLRTLHPNPSGDYIRDSVIYKTKADEKGQWKIIMARETAEGMKLAFWAKNDPTLFSLGVEWPNGQTALIRDIVINNKTAEKKIDVVIKPSKNPSTFDTDNRR